MFLIVACTVLPPTAVVLVWEGQKGGMCGGVIREDNYPKLADKWAGISGTDHAVR